LWRALSFRRLSAPRPVADPLCLRPPVSLQGEERPAWKDVMRQEGVDDMTLLPKITNEAIRDNLHERYQNDIIYTSISDVLISMNPYKMLPIYESSIIQDYVGRSRIELPPHIFSVAEESYRSMLNDQKNQCVIISGESGAGKTEAAKKIMQYVAEVTGGEEGSRLAEVKRIILETNPLLEAFGNAQTLRNDNSSRFGKYFELQFTSKGDPDGGTVTNYLLEKARVTFQIEGERNFHIFYQFCAGATQGERDKFGIHGPENYVYCSWGNHPVVDTIDDVQEWNDTLNAMSTIGITQAEQDAVKGMVAAIMWLGNVDYQETSGKAKITDQSSVQFVAGLLQVPQQFLSEALEQRTMQTSHGMKRGTTYKVPLNYVQACANRDAVAKAIYSSIFDWLVLKINIALKATASQLSIGVLDIYGFEVFEHNSFEQLCINYVNEKLQQIFIEFTLKSEQAEYVAEGIQWTPIKYFDNKPVCELIENRNPVGIFAVLNDVAKSVHAMAEGADQALEQRLPSVQSPNFAMRHGHFVVKHFAGDVNYEVTGLVEKNKDILSDDLLQLVQCSELPLLKQMFMEAGKVVTTAGDKIKKSANELSATLSKCAPHYVRCLKPNDQKAADYFEPDRVVHQIKYLGLLDNVKVRRSGFAHRAPFDKFIARYFLVSPRTSYAGQNTWNGSVIDGCRACLEDAPVANEEWQIGKTKVFLRHPETLFAFEDLRVNYYHNMVSRIKQAFRTSRGFQHFAADRIKKAFKVWKYHRDEACMTIQRFYRMYKGAAPYYDLKMHGEQFMQGKKQRHRFSLTSVRKFFGDYLQMDSQQELKRAMGGGASEAVYFSAKAQMVISAGLLGTQKLSPRFLVITASALYLIKMQQKKGLVEHILERSVPLNMITGATFSTQHDDFAVLHTPLEQKEHWDIPLKTDFATEMVTWLSAYGQVGSNVQFNDLVEWRKKGGGKKKITFVQDNMHKMAAENPFFKKGKIFTSPGEAASSQVKQFAYRTTGDPKEPVQIVEPEQIRNNKGTATAAVRGTTRVAAGFKNEMISENLLSATGAAAPSAGRSSRGGGGAPPSRRGGPPKRGAAAPKRSRGGAPPGGAGARGTPPARTRGAPPKRGGGGGGGGGAPKRGGAPPKRGGGGPPKRGAAPKRGGGRGRGPPPGRRGGM
jgi:myosin I